MVRWFAGVVLVALMASNVFFYVRSQRLDRAVTSSQEQLALLSAESKRQSDELRDAVNQLAGLRTASAGQPTQIATPVPRGMVGELALAQSYKVDRIVDWVGLLEDKIYFLLFPPLDPQEKERQALTLQTRTNDIRLQFQTVAQHELSLRESVAQRLKNESSTQP